MEWSDSIADSNEPEVDVGIVYDVPLDPLVGVPLVGRHPVKVVVGYTKNHFDTGVPEGLESVTVRAIESHPPNPN